MNDAGPILGYNNKMMRSQQRKSTLLLCPPLPRRHPVTYP